MSLRKNIVFPFHFDARIGLRLGRLIHLRLDSETAGLAIRLAADCVKNEERARQTPQIPADREQTAPPDPRPTGGCSGGHSVRPAQASPARSPPSFHRAACDQRGSRERARRIEHRHDHRHGKRNQRQKSEQEADHALPLDLVSSREEIWRRQLAQSSHEKLKRIVKRILTCYSAARPFQRSAGTLVAKDAHPAWQLPNHRLDEPRARQLRRAQRRGGRVVEGARLESVYTAKPYRGFESPSLRQLIQLPY